MAKERVLGLTFTERDLQMAKRLVRVLDSFDYKLPSGKMVIEAAEALTWYALLLPKIEANLFELIESTKVPPAKPTEEAPST